MKVTHCKQGHRYTGKNIRWVKVRGAWYRTCRKCKTRKSREKYHSDPIFREYKRKASLAYYHANKSDSR